MRPPAKSWPASTTVVDRTATKIEPRSLIAAANSGDAQVLDSLGLSSTDLSAQILNNHDPSQKVLDELVPIVCKGLEATA